MDFKSYKQLTFTRHDNGVLLITMDRPEKYNATDEEMRTPAFRAIIWTICPHRRM